MCVAIARPSVSSDLLSRFETVKGDAETIVNEGGVGGDLEVRILLPESGRSDQEQHQANRAAESVASRVVHTSLRLTKAA